VSNTLARHKHQGTSFLMGGEGEPFLFLHGIPGSALTWKAVGELLSDHYRVVLPDLAGFGDSDPPDGDYYMEAQATHVKQLLDRLGIEEFYLGGHDFGGPVALTLIRLYPELKVKGLVLSATNVFTNTHIPAPLRTARIPVLGTLLFKLLAGNRTGLRMMYLVATSDKNEAPWTRFKQHLTPSAVDLTRRIFQRSLANLKNNYQMVEDSLADLTIPTLVLWGTRDPFFGLPVGDRTHQAIRGSVLKVYERTGHFVPEEKPNLVARDIVSFFKNKSSRLTHPHTNQTPQ
jgi:pimeloyl-ACP methyl ester carboxylesterase